LIEHDDIGFQVVWITDNGSIGLIFRWNINTRRIARTLIVLFVILFVVSVVGNIDWEFDLNRN